MTTAQKLGQLRAFLTALGSALAVWGVNDPTGSNWTPIVGVVMAGGSLTWGVLHHRGNRSAGQISWSLVRKLFNAAGSAAITYGMIHPDKVHGAEMLLAAMGPFLATWFSWIDNSEPTDSPDKEV